MLRYRFFLLILVNGIVLSAYSQAEYMHEAYEDAVESGSNGAFGIISLIIFFGIVWLISKIYDSHKENKKIREDIKRDKKNSTKASNSIIQKHPDISKYQTKESWQKGFANATFDISHNRIKTLGEKTIDDLVKEYRSLCEQGHMVQAESIMEQIGYFQKLEFNQKQLEVEKKAKEQVVTKPTSQQSINTPTTSIKEERPIETDEYILSSDKKTLLRGKDVEIIHVPLGVEIIKDRAFEHLKHIKEVIIPEGVKVIGSWAFDFSPIEKLVIPSTIEKIGECAFYFCQNLKTVEIKEGVKTLGLSMFANCDLLESVSLPSTLSSIPDSCFDGCMSLEDINIPFGITYIGDSAFCNCSSLSKVILPESVTDIGIEAFRECSELKTMTIPSKVVGLSDRLFYDDYKLGTVILPNNLTCIMSSVFYQCSNLKVKLPQSVSRVGKDAFMSCHDMRLEVPKGKKEWIESLEENVKGHVTEYEYDEEYILTKEIKEKTNRFLTIHNEKNRRRSDEIMESLGLATSRDDDYLMYDNPMDDFDNDYYDDDY